jgi:hypothetical protein
MLSLVAQIEGKNAMKARFGRVIASTKQNLTEAVLSVASNEAF